MIGEFFLGFLLIAEQMHSFMVIEREYHFYPTSFGGRVMGDVMNELPFNPPLEFKLTWIPMKDEKPNGFSVQTWLGEVF